MFIKQPAACSGGDTRLSRAPWAVQSSVWSTSDQGKPFKTFFYSHNNKLGLPYLLVLPNENLWSLSSQRQQNKLHDLLGMWCTEVFFFPPVKAQLWRLLPVKFPSLHVSRSSWRTAVRMSWQAVGSETQTPPQSYFQNTTAKFTGCQLPKQLGAN